MDIQSIQSRALARLGEDLTDRRLQQAFSTLVYGTVATRARLDLDGSRAELVSDEDVMRYIGDLAIALIDAACVLGVDLEAAMIWGERAAEARAVSALVESAPVLVSMREVR